MALLDAGLAPRRYWGLNFVGLILSPPLLEPDKPYTDTLSLPGYSGSLRDSFVLESHLGHLCQGFYQTFSPDSHSFLSHPPPAAKWGMCLERLFKN